MSIPADYEEQMTKAKRAFISLHPDDSFEIPSAKGKTRSEARAPLDQHIARKYSLHPLRAIEAA